MLQYQTGQAIVWRDAVTNWFLHESGIADSAGRVGHYIGRVEAESMQLDGYETVAVTPWEAASGGQAIECKRAYCTAAFRYDGQPGWRTLRIEYFDQNNGAAKYRVFVNDQPIDQWTAADHLPTQKLDGTSSTRRTVSGIALRPGDRIRIEGMPDAQETAALDYVEVTSEPN